jgi:hypothetical protein
VHVSRTGRRLGFRDGALFASVLLAAVACGGDRPAGRVQGPARAPAVIAAEAAGQAEAWARLASESERPEAPRDTQILFGDLHVHTTYSLDAFAMELPLTGLQGVHTPADACDFARHCAGLDFFSLNDHAERLTPEHWAATKDVLRHCDALAGAPGDQDLIAFAGWEWTQIGLTPATHWGHKNVVFPGLADAELPARPISSRTGGEMGIFDNVRQATGARWVDPLGWKDYADLDWLLRRIESVPPCPRGVPTRDLPPDCHESAATPADLYAKLDEWGFPALVIPHGNAWGLYTPPGASWDHALARAQHDPRRQRLLEIMSGHGNSEEYRSFRPGTIEDRDPICPAPSEAFLPCCWQAGEIMRRRCGALDPATCEARVDEARRLAVMAGASVRQVFPDATAEDWLDCDQCRDCFKPSFSLRPRETAQYALAISSFDEPEPGGRPLRFRFGFIASTDDHTARPGTGYKQYERRKMTFATGIRSDRFEFRTPMDEPDRPQRVEPRYVVPDAERTASFSFPGGIVAVHAAARSRPAVWDALMRREVYGTSGPRILLWFDLVNGPDGVVPMGGETVLAEGPRFEVRAAGDFVQRPGCPATSAAALSTDRLAYLCADECYHPGEERHAITAVEVVRIRPQAHPHEPVDRLIEDPWKRFECPGTGTCTVTFADAEFTEAGRDTVYYVRALQEPTPAVNGATLRTELDGDGNAVRTRPCYGDHRTPLDDDCVAPVAERAWSSPIFVNHAAPAG